MSDSVGLRRWLLQSLKFQGFTVRADALDFLVEKFANIPGAQTRRNEVLENLTDQLGALNTESLVVDRRQIEHCFEESLLDKPSSETVWNVVDAFDCPRFVYSRELRKFVKDVSVKKQGLFSDAPSKVFMRKRLYDVIMHRTLKLDAIKKVFTVNETKFQYVVQTAEWFLCETKRVEHAVIIGLLVQKPDGKYAVEDSTGSLDIDISQATFADGLFPEHCFVFLEGIYEDKIFYVSRFGLPPAETSEASRPYFDEMNSFGGPSEFTLKNSKALRAHEQSKRNETMVFISDLWLDKPQVLKQLKILFDKLAGTPPIAFVFLGNFVSSQKVATYGEQLKRGFAALGNLISNYEGIRENSHFVLVPGPFDIGSPKILPRPALSKHLVKDMAAKVSMLTLASNPCRIQYCTKEVVVIREDLVSKMCRNTIHFPSEASGKISYHFTKTVLSQGTLVPMSLLVCPVYWNFSHSLDLNPLPDLVVASDQFNSFTEEHMDCIVTSPGSFVKQNFSFKIYTPSRNTVEDSLVSGDV